ncbi:hypothetical protein SynMVIR181_02894 [Synechococcus sp. MVIR-18-1]|nr:hypothetical protein SynMVIR181_02894 [Synechococcus sp. MVIR-18-1]
MFPGHEEFESHDFEVGVSDWGVVSPMNTPSPESMSEVMTRIKRCCDLDHRVDSFT